MILLKVVTFEICVHLSCKIAFLSGHGYNYLSLGINTNSKDVSGEEGGFCIWGQPPYLFEKPALA